MHYGFWLALVGLGICASACAAYVRPVVSLDGVWKLTLPPGKDSYEIKAPGAWGTQIPELRGYTGQATYSRKIEVPESWDAKRVFIIFGAVDYFARVFVNGKQVGEHEGGYTPFEFEVGDQLDFGGQNEIKVVVLDPGPGKPVGGFRFEEIPHGKQSWYGNASGLWQSASLEARSASYIERVVIDPDIDSSRARFRAVIAGEAKGVVRVSYSRPQRTKVVAETSVELRGQKEIAWEAAIPEARLWSPDDPALYSARVELVVDGRVVDSVTESFGMRKIEARDGKILLNGKPIFLAGALDQDFYPITEYSVPSDEYLKDQFAKAKRLGLNMLRCHIKVPEPRYLEWADRLGLLVWYEIPNWDQLTEDAKRRGRETLEAMLRRDHNHPSLVIVSIINEAWGIDWTNPEHTAWLAEMYDFAKSLEPDRLIVDNSACGRNFHARTDMEDFHMYCQIPEQAAAYRDWVRDFATHPAWTFDSEGRYKRRGFEPLVLSEFGNWGLPRLSKLTKTYEQDPWWFDTSRRAESIATLPGGVQERFKEWHLDGVFGTMDALSDAFQDQEWRALKFQIEEMRKYPSIVGYVITEFTDLHWESNGLLDFCRNRKTFHQIMHTVQGQTIVFAQPERHNFVSGEKPRLDVYVSHFSSHDLEGAKVVWQVAESLVRGEIAVDTIRRGEGGRVGAIVLEAPNVRVPRGIEVKLALVDRARKTLALNCAESAVFPRSEPKAPADVLVSDVLDEDTLRQIAEGRNAVVCIQSPEGLNAELGGLKVVDRKEEGRWGAWCSSVSWLRKSRAFEGLPVPKVMDFAFENVYPNCVITGIGPGAYGKDVLSGIFAGWLQANAALIAQVRSGKGKAIITTLPLVSASKSDPMARWLLAGLAKYVASEECKPGIVIQ